MGPGPNDIQTARPRITAYSQATARRSGADPPSPSGRERHVAASATTASTVTTRPGKQLAFAASPVGSAYCHSQLSTGRRR